MPNQDPHIAQELLSHQAFLRRLAIDLVGQDADDLVQDVWQRALERPPQHGRQLRGWLARVARNLAANRWRDEARRRSREVRRASEQPAVDELEARFELRKAMVGALDSLNASCRETILLRYFEGLAPREIAKRQGAPVATVKTRLRRGLGQLREELDKRHGGDRAAWMSAVTALATPVGGVGTGTLVIGGMAMGTMLKVSAAVLVATACVVFAVRAPRTESPRIARLDPQAAEVELVGPGALTPDDPAAESMRRSSVPEEGLGDESAAVETNVLRVILEGLTEESAGLAKVTLTGLDERSAWPAEVRDSWPCKGLTSDFDLGPFMAKVKRHGNLRVDELVVEVDHPLRLLETTRVPLPRGAEAASGQAVHEVRMRLVQPEYWPEFTLAVRGAHTREHLEDIELRFTPGVVNSMWGQNGTSTLLGERLRSPIELMGGRAADEPEPEVAGLALRPPAGESPRLIELMRRLGPERGVIVSARAPGYAWGSTSLDVSQGDRELLLESASTLDVRLTGVQLERYAALEKVAMLCVYWIRADGGNQYVRFEPLDETLENDGLRLDSLVPGGYRVTVELDGGSWTERPVLASAELSLAAFETRELVLALADPPAPPERATLGGTVSFPAFGGEEQVRLQLYHQASQRSRDPDVELSLADLRRVGGALPTWSFRAEDLPVGLYRVQLLPFLKVWMMELPVGGAEDVELVLPELAEVLVETVDAQTRERVPLDEFYYRNKDALPRQLQNEWARADHVEPGRFRFWAAPGTVRVWPRFPRGLDYGETWEDLELIPGLQSVRFELAHIYAMRFEFREGGVALPVGDPGMHVKQNILPVDHEGHVITDGLQTDMRVEVSAPGIYEIRFDGLDAARYYPIPPRHIDVRPGETAEVIVELQRK